MSKTLQDSEVTAVMQRLSLDEQYRLARQRYEAIRDGRSWPWHTPAHAAPEAGGR